MAFVSSPSSTNEVNTAYGVSTANTQVSPASTQVSTASTQVSTANLSDATVYAFFSNQPNGSHLVHEDLEQIHEDDLIEMDLKWQLALLSMRTRRFFHKTGRKITINGSHTAGYMADDEFPTNMALMAFSDSEPKFEGYGPKSSKSVSKDISNKVMESLDDPLVEELVSDDKSQNPRGNQRNWNNQKSQQLGSDFVMYNKACFVCGSFDHVQADCNYHQRERVVSGNNYTWVNYNYSAKKAHPSAHRNIVPRAVLMKTSLKPLSTARHGHPQKEDQCYVDSGCLRHMTRNMCYLSDFKEFDGGYVTFWGVAKGGKITASKDETSDILKSFITQIENLVDKKVKIIRCDNGTEFKNRVMSEFCEKKGIKREFSVARTPQQNGVAERRNLDIIEGYTTLEPGSEKNLQVRFLEDKPIIAGTKESIGVSHSSKETASCQDCILMPLWKDGSLFDFSSKNASNDEQYLLLKIVWNKTDDINTTPLEDTHADFFGDETEVDMSNISTTYPVSFTLNTRIHKDHSLAQVICDIQSSVQTRRMINEQGFISAVYEGKTHEDLYNCLFACFLSQEEPKKKQLNLGVGTERMIFNIDYVMKHFYSNDDTCFSIDVIDEILEEDFDALLDEGSKILHSIEGTLLEEEIFAEFNEFIAMTTDENSDSESDTEDSPFEKITINTDYKIKTSLEEPLTDLELKPLPNNLEYVFLKEPSFLPVIISSQLSKEKKNQLIFVLKKHKQAFA
ncbi:ribonuclease H-like domain-containing protein [Tanacetum coccineum]